MCSALLRIGYLTSQPSGEPPSCSPCPVTGSVSTHVLNTVSARPQGEGLLGTAPVLERMRQELVEDLACPGHPGLSRSLPVRAASLAIQEPWSWAWRLLRREEPFSSFYPLVPLPSRGRGLGGSVWVPERLTRAAAWCSEPLQACPAFLKCSSQASQALHHLPPDPVCPPACSSVYWFRARTYCNFLLLPIFLRLFPRSGILFFLAHHDPAHSWSLNPVSSRKPSVNAQAGLFFSEPQ